MPGFRDDTSAPEPAPLALLKARTALHTAVPGEGQGWPKWRQLLRIPGVQVVLARSALCNT